MPRSSFVVRSMLGAAPLLALAAVLTAAVPASAPLVDLPADDIQLSALANPTSGLWRYGQVYPNGLPTARTNIATYAAPGIMNVGRTSPWVVTATINGWVQVRNAADGARVHDLKTGDGGIQASPVIVDWDRDGRPDILAANLNGDLVVWNTDGRELLRRNIYTDNLPTHTRGIFSTPVAADLDGDGWLEIVLTSWDHHLYVLNHDGTVRRKLFLKDTSWASPAVADVDGNGVPEIVAAWDCDANSRNFDCAYGNPGGFIGVFDRDLNLRWRQFMPGQAAWSSPAVGAVRGDGRLAVVIGTGQMPCMMYTGAAGPCGTGSAVDTRSTGRHVYGFDAATGAPLSGWPAPLPEKTMSSPALADVDGDGRLETFIATAGRVYRINSDGQVLWGSNTCVALLKNPCGYAPLQKIDASPVVGDFLGDGRQLVAISYDFKVTFVDAVTGAVVATTEPSRTEWEIGLGLGQSMTSTTWGGKTWLYTNAMLCRSDCYGSNPVWDGGTVVVQGGPTAGRVTWPTFRGQLSRTGKAQVMPNGAIGGYWSATGGAAGHLGSPTSDEYGVPGGRAQSFAGGRVYWSASTGAHSVIGSILATYLWIGGPGALGLPVAEEGSGGAPGVAMSTFQRGRVYWSATTGSHGVWGAVLGRYLETGGPAGPLGLPIGSEEPGGVPGAVMSKFQHGRVYWSAATGAKEVRGGILNHYLTRGGPARYGLPTRPEYTREGGQAVDFSGGRIYWTASEGTSSMQGGLLNAYDAEGGAGAYGLPTGDEVAGPLPGSAHSQFRYGEMHWSAGTGAHGVVGEIRRTWHAAGWATGGLGLPTTSERAGPSSSRQNRFQNGDVHWSPTTGAHVVFGGICQYWWSLGGPSSWLGLPISGEYAVPGGRRSDFVGGSITYVYATGTMVTSKR